MAKDSATTFFECLAVEFKFKDKDTNQSLKMIVRAKNLTEAKNKFNQLTDNKVDKYKIENVFNDLSTIPL